MCIQHIDNQFKRVNLENYIIFDLLDYIIV